MMHTINLGKLTNRLNKLRDKSNLHHFFLIEIFPLKIEAQLNVGKVLDVTMLAKIVEMLILSPHYNFISVRMGPVLSLQQR